MLVGHGPKGTRPPGRLPVFTTNTKKEAEELLALACEQNAEGKYIARELAHEQTLENLQAFSERLNAYYQVMQRKK